MEDIGLPSETINQLADILKPGNFENRYAVLPSFPSTPAGSLKRPEFTVGRAGIRPNQQDGDFNSRLRQCVDQPAGRSSQPTIDDRWKFGGRVENPHREYLYSTHASPRSASIGSPGST